MIRYRRVSSLTGRYGVGKVSPVPNLGASLPARMPESSGDTVDVTTVAAMQTAISGASNGRTIRLRQGNYPHASTGIFIQNKNFSALNPITITSYPGEMATFTGNPNKELGAALILEGANGIRLRGLTFTTPVESGLSLDSCADVEIDQCIFANNGIGGLGLMGNSGVNGSLAPRCQRVQLLNSTFTHNGGFFPGNEPYAQKGDHSVYWGGGPNDGVQHGADGGLIANCVVYDQHTGAGMQIGQFAWNLIITNNTIYHASNSTAGADAGIGISLFNDTAFATRNVLIVNNIITDCFSNAVNCTMGATMPSNIVRNNLAFNNHSPDYQPTYGTKNPGFTDQGNRPNANPLYVNTAAHNFRLQVNSPARNVAEPAYSPSTDRDGNPRSATPSLGAYE